MATFAKSFLKLTLFDKTIFDGSARFSHALALLNAMHQPIQGSFLKDLRAIGIFWLPSNKKARVARAFLLVIRRS